MNLTNNYNLSIIQFIAISITFGFTLILFFLSWGQSLGMEISFISFSFLSMILLTIGFIQKISIGYMVFSILIYLGFFLKHTIHLVYSYNYLEPIGRFDYSSFQWNEFYKISSIGFFSFIILGVGLIFFQKKLSNNNFEIKRLSISLKRINFSWLILIIFGVSLLVLNEIYQFQKLGIEKEKNFSFWFLEISIVMLMSVVFPIFMYVVSFYEINQRNNFYKTIFFIMTVSSLFSISILSRSIIVFWCMPLLFLPLFKKINLKQYAFILVLYIFFIFFTVGISTLSRTVSKITVNTSVHTSVNTLNRLLVDRWIGVEGLMVSIGIENKNIFNLFYERTSQEVDFFTSNALNQKIEKGHIITSYATLPGIIGYLYLNGSKVVLFFGCFFFVFLIILIERVILWFTQNFILSTYVAISLAISIAGFGIDLMSWIKVQILTIFVVFILHYIFIKFLKGKKN